MKFRVRGRIARGGGAALGLAPPPRRRGFVAGVSVAALLGACLTSVTPAAGATAQPQAAGAHASASAGKEPATPKTPETPGAPDTPSPSTTAPPFSASPGSKPHPYIDSPPDAKSLQKARDAGQATADFGPDEKVVKAWYAHKISTDQMVRYGYATFFAPDQVPADLRPGQGLADQLTDYLSFITAHEGDASQATRDWVAGFTAALKDPSGIASRRTNVVDVLADVRKPGSTVKPDTTAKPDATAKSNTTTKTDKAAKPAALTTTASLGGSATDPGCQHDPIDYPDIPGFNHRYACMLSTPHFNVLYNHGIMLEDAEPNGQPESVWTIAQNAEEAYLVYSSGDPALGIPGLGLPEPTTKPMTILVGDALHDDTHWRRPNVVAEHVAATLPIGPGGVPSFWMPEDPKPYDAFIRHEVFHAFQYQYMPDISFDYASLTFTDGRFGSKNWWMEATAQWAVLESYRLFPDWPGGVANKDYYYKNLADYLGGEPFQNITGRLITQAHRPVNAWDGLAESRQYGVFPLAEYLTEAAQQATGNVNDVSAVRRTWEKVKAGVLPLDAINQVFQGYGFDLNQTWLQYAVANYRMQAPTNVPAGPSTTPPDGYTLTDAAVAWPGKLGGEPTRDASTFALPGVVQQDVVNDLYGGGQAFVDFDAPQLAGVPDDQGRGLTVTILPKDAPGIQWELIAWQPTSYGRPDPVISARPDPVTGQATVVVPGVSEGPNAPRPHFTLVLANTKFNADSQAAELESQSIPYTHVTFAVPHLVTDGSLSASGTLAGGQPQWMWFTTTSAQIALSCNVYQESPNTGWSPAISLFGPTGASIPTNSAGCRTDTAQKLALDRVPTAAAGTYLVRFTAPAANTGNLSAQLWASTDFKGTATPNGSAGTIPANVIGQDGYIAFQGVPGDHLAVGCAFSSATNSKHLPIYLYDPTGKLVTSVADNNSVEDCSNNGTQQKLALDYVKITQAGAYQLRFGPAGMDVGSVTYWIWQSQDLAVTGTTDGTKASVTTTVVGQDAYVSFPAVQGQHLAVACSFVAAPSATAHLPIYLYGPTGSQVASVADNNSVQDCSTTGNLPNLLALDYITVPTTGQYQLRLGPDGLSTGTVSFWMWATTDTKGTVATNGTPTTVTVGTVGQNADLTFTAAAGQRLGVACAVASSPATAHMPLTLYDPGNLQVTSVAVNNGVQDCSTNGTVSTTALGGTNLLSGGTYRLRIDPENLFTGQITIWVWTSSSLTVPAGLDGSLQTPAVTTPGQDVWVTFTGTAGDQFTMACGLATTPGADWEPYVQLYDPTGKQLVGLYPTFGGPCAKDGTQRVAMDGVTLTASGAYRLHFDPQSIPGTGSLKVWLWASTPTKAAASTNGTAASTVVTKPSQDVWLNFPVTAGQHLLFACSVTPASGSAWQPALQIYDPTGKQMTGIPSGTTGPCGTGGTMKSAWSGLALPTAGTYSIRVDPQGTSTGTVQTAVTLS